MAKAGRPKGSRNKLNATDEISKAISRGKGLVELKQWLWDEMQKDSITDLQKSKYVAMYADIIKFIHSEGLKIEANSEENVTQKDNKQDVQKGQNTGNTPVTPSVVSPLKFGKK